MSSIAALGAVQTTLSKIRQTTHEELTEDIIEGFEKLDDNLLDRKAPRIKFLKGFDEKEDIQKIDYLKRLASTMNHAAKLISNERDELVKLMILKERQLEQMSLQLQQNSTTVQDQVLRMNAQKQHFSAEVSRLTSRVKELEGKV